MLEYDFPFAAFSIISIWESNSVDKNKLLFVVAFIALLSVIVALWINEPVSKRPQEPQKPYPYYSEDVKFRNEEAGIYLSGTLTLPERNGNYPVIILITGSGAQNRDEEIFSHKPFLVIADHLTKNGIAVLRFDDRGTGLSTGNFKTATSLDFSHDVESAVTYLKTRKEINIKQIGLAGHSEGGLIAPMVASRSRDISFMILLAAPAIRLDSALLIQDELIARVLGVSETEIETIKKRNAAIYALVKQSTDLTTLKADLGKLAKEQNILDAPPQLMPPKMTKEQFISAQLGNFSSPWFRYVMQYDPAKTLRKVKCPVLAINGSKDLQVSPKENLNAINVILKTAGNDKVTVKELSDLNHLFQESETGSPLDYRTIEQTFSPVALNLMSDWIKKQVNLGQ
jgi:alpha-beta hydrolase superfamily lysophospholipase